MRSEASGRFSARPRGLRLAGVAALVAAIALGAGALYCALRGDALLAGAIEEIVAQVTDTPAELDGVDVDLGARRVVLAELRIGNPAGFERPTALRLGAVTADVEDAVGDGPIVLREMRMGAPSVTVEIREGGRTNLAVLREQILASARAGAVGGEPAEPGDVVANVAAGTRVRIESLEMAPARVRVDASEYGPDEPIDLTLPAIALRGVGGAEGATPAELTRTISLALIDATTDAVTDATLGPIDEAVDAVKEKGRELIEKLRD